MDRTQWTTLDPRTSADLYSVVEPTGFEVWMGGDMGVVRMNLYAGWFERDLPSQLGFRVFTRRGGQCTAVGPGGLMFRWTAGFWSEIATGVAVDLNGGAGNPTGSAWVVGDEGTILRTTDGNTWDQVESGTTADLYAVVELDLTNLYAVGEAGTILKSTDAGLSWSARESGTTSTLRAVSISKSDHSVLLAVGLGGTVLRSMDAGDSWCHLEVTTADLYAVEAYSNLEFFVGGAGGLLLRTTNGGGSCGVTNVEEVQSPPILSIHGPFPQPSRDVASLRVSVDRVGSYLGGERRDLTVSYVWSHGVADLNNYDQFYGNIRNPIIRPNEHNLIPTDVPHRLLVRGKIGLPGRWDFAPVLEIRSGFPWSAVDAFQDFVGERNRAGRLPLVSTFDFSLSRPFNIWKYRFRGGIKVYNMFGATAERDVQSNVTSPSFGQFYNPLERSFGFVIGSAAADTTAAK